MILQPNVYQWDVVWPVVNCTCEFSRKFCNEFSIRCKFLAFNLVYGKMRLAISTRLLFTHEKLSLFDKDCLLLIDRVDVTCNYDFNNFTVKIHNDGIHDTIFNVTMQLFFRVEKIMININMKTPLDNSDNEYGSELFSSSVNPEKVMRGKTGNFIIKIVAESFLKSLDFVPKFPMEPVRILSLTELSIYKTLLQGLYNAINLTFSEKTVPFPVPNIKFLFELRFCC